MFKLRSQLCHSLVLLFMFIAVAGCEPCPVGDLCTIPSPPPSAPPDTRVQIILRSLHCAKTTEVGHDEFYYFMGGVDANGNKVSSRGPNGALGADADNQTAWDMNDSGSEQDRTPNAILYEGSLVSGQSMTLPFAFYESDGTDYGATLRAAAALAEKVSGDPTVAVVANLVSFLSGLIPTNQDDFLGGFYLRIENKSGSVQVAEVAGAGFTSSVNLPNPDPGTFALRFNHDDGDYTAKFQIIGVK